MWYSFIDFKLTRRRVIAMRWTAIIIGWIITIPSYALSAVAWVGMLPFKALSWVADDKLGSAVGWLVSTAIACRQWLARNKD